MFLDYVLLYKYLITMDITELLNSYIKLNNYMISLLIHNSYKRTVACINCPFVFYSGL